MANTPLKQILSLCFLVMGIFARVWQTQPNLFFTPFIFFFSGV
jgi:hypothetical protein